MSNVKIRKAISYSIDREEMIDAVYGRYNPAYSYVAPAITFNGIFLSFSGRRGH